MPDHTNPLDPKPIHSTGNSESDSSVAREPDQRDDTRYACNGSVEFCIEGSDVRTFAKVVDISFGGCYVEMTATSARGTRLNLAIGIDGRRIRARGVVQTSYPCLGMGIEFTEITLDDRALLSEVLLSLSRSSEKDSVKEVHSGLVAIPPKIDARSALNEIARLFESLDALKRDDFLRVLSKSIESR